MSRREIRSSPSSRALDRPLRLCALRHVQHKTRDESRGCSFTCDRPSSFESVLEIVRLSVEAPWRHAQA